MPENKLLKSFEFLFWSFLKKKFCKRAIAVSVQMPTTCKEGFSSLVEIMSKKKKKLNTRH